MSVRVLWMLRNLRQELSIPHFKWHGLVRPCTVRNVGLSIRSIRCPCGCGRSFLLAVTGYIYSSHSGSIWKRIDISEQIISEMSKDFHLQTWIWIAKFHAFLDSRFWTVSWIDSLTCCNVRCVGHQRLQFTVDFLIPILLHVDLVFRSGCFPEELSHFTPENQQTSTFALISSAV